MSSCFGQSACLLGLCWSENQVHLNRIFWAWSKRIMKTKIVDLSIQFPDRWASSNKNKVWYIVMILCLVVSSAQLWLFVGRCVRAISYDTYHTLMLYVACVECLSGLIVRHSFSFTFGTKLGLFCGSLMGLLAMPVPPAGLRLIGFSFQKRMAARQCHRCI